MRRKLNMAIWACVEYSIFGINIHPWVNSVMQKISAVQWNSAAEISSAVQINIPVQINSAVQMNS